MSQQGSKKPRVMITPPTHDWSALGKLSLHTTAGHLNTIDHVRFRSVCTSWRVSSAKRPKTPLLITTGYTEEGLSLYDLVRIENIPLPKNTYIAFLQSMGAVYVGCSFGWIALAREMPFHERAIVITLFNPFTLALPIELSDLTGLRLFSGRVLLSGSPSNRQQPPMVVYHSVNPRHLKFQQIGDERWKTIPHTSSLTEVIACNGRFYGYSSNNELYSVDLQAYNGMGSVDQVMLDLPDMFSGHVPPPRWMFLADFSGDLVVACSHNDRELFLKVDLENLRLVLMTNNMAGCLLFQFQSCSFYINPAGDGSLKIKDDDGNHIIDTGSPNNVIIILAEQWKHPDPRIRQRAVPLGWITPHLNMP